MPVVFDDKANRAQIALNQQGGIGHRRRTVNASTGALDKRVRAELQAEQANAKPSGKVEGEGWGVF